MRAEPLKQPKPDTCELCQRRKPLSFHHLIPKRNHRRKRFKRRFSREEMTGRGAWLCAPCHRHLHKMFDEQTLGLHLNTLPALAATPEVAAFLVWARKQK